MVTYHTCHAVGCKVAVPERLLMCVRHWRMVPLPLQRLVWRYYRNGQETRKDPSASYMCASTMARAAVAAREDNVLDATRLGDEAADWADKANDPALVTAILAMARGDA